MSKMFIRHSILENQFIDYSKLTFSQHCDLATNRINPGINLKSKEYLLEIYPSNPFKKIQKIYISESRRTKETAELIKSVYKLNAPILIDRRLNEMYFDPAKLCKEEVFAKNGMSGIRAVIYKSLITHKTGVEPLEKICKRLNSFVMEVNHQNEILCITHGFLLTILQLCMNKQSFDFNQITLSELESMQKNEYLKGFDLENN